ncbi:MAG: alpha/beta hydrolase [Myxococcota bacterium]
MPNAIDHVARFVLMRQGYRSEQVDTGSAVMRALVHDGEGDLPPLTVLHGWSSMGVHQGIVVRGLRRRVRRVVLPDLPGHGWSTCPSPLNGEEVTNAIHTAFPQWHPEPAVWMGSSFGGYVALRYALMFPEHVRSLILVSPAGAPMTDDERHDFITLLRARTEADVRRFLDRVSARPKRRNWLFAKEMRKVLRRRPLQDMLDHQENFHPFTEAELDRVRVPVTLVWGRKESLWPRHHLAFWRKLPNVEVYELEHSGHSPSIDQPFKFGAIVEEHLKRVT